MIKSMTGFSSLTRDDARGPIGVTIRAVNHRYLDLQLRLPSPLAGLEPRLRAIVQRRLARGRVEIAVSWQPRAAAPDVELNAEFTQSLGAALDRAREAGLVHGPLTPGDLLRLPQAITIRERALDVAGDDSGLGAAVDAALEAALDDLDTMRTREGRHLQDDLAARRDLLDRLITRIAAAAEEGRGALETRLLERARDLGSSLPIDQGALAQEVVRVAQRSDISEEVTRFRGHLAHWGALADGEEPCGRKLDFLLQEMNREVNTTGAKADGLTVSELIIEAKAELERMREQVQNVE